MKAVYVNEYGGLDKLRYGDVPDPVPAQGQVVVDIYAASVNAAETPIIAGISESTSGLIDITVATT